METPELFQANYCNDQFAAEKSLSDARHSDQFIIEDLLDFPSDENIAAADGGFEAAVAGTSTDSSAVTAVDNSCHSSFSNFQAAGVGAPGEGPFAGELCVPYDDMAELEWLSNFVDESFSSVDLPKLHLIHGIKARPEESPEAHHHHQFQPEPTRSGPTLPSEVSIPAKARSKRSRAAPGSWTSRLLAVASPPAADSPAMSSSSSSSPSRKKLAAPKKKELPENMAAAAEAPAGEVRKCLHCATDKTPQWRTGPMGPKTLCNACGVRYKSGRLVPEYRPAASPTFVTSKHSNSHRKVMELRRQKEMVRAPQPLVHQHHNHPIMMFDISNGEDYLIPQHIGPDFGPVI